jgi:hypothetical protein
MLMLGRSCLFRAALHIASRTSSHLSTGGPCGHFMPVIRAASTSASAGSKMNTSKRGKFKLRPGKHDPELKDVLRQFVKRVCLLGVYLRVCELRHVLVSQGRLVIVCSTRSVSFATTVVSVSCAYLCLRTFCVKRVLPFVKLLTRAILPGPFFVRAGAP